MIAATGPSIATAAASAVTTSSVPGPSRPTRFRSRPVIHESTATTVAPSPSNRSQTWVPRNPPPPSDDPLAVPIALHRALLPGTRELNRFERSDPAGEP